MTIVPELRSLSSKLKGSLVDASRKSTVMVPVLAPKQITSVCVFTLTSLCNGHCALAEKEKIIPVKKIRIDTVVLEKKIFLILLDFNSFYSRCD